VTSGHVLAVDAGNTKSVVLVADREGTVVGRAVTGPGDIYGADREETATSTVLAAVDAALGDAGVPASDVVAATCCLAGVDWPEDRALWSGLLASRLPSARLEVLNDGFALLWCLNPGGVGVAVTVGTGPAIAARGADGSTAAMGFWCQDALGGVGLADLALRAVYLAEQGLGPATALRSALLEWSGFGDVESLLHSFTRRGSSGSWCRAASAAPVVLACAAEGDPVSVALVADQARLLVDYADATARRAGLDLGGGQRGDDRVGRDAGEGGPLKHPDDAEGEGWPLALGGGVVASGLPVFREALLAEIGTRLPGAVPVVVEVEPVVGSLVGALGLVDPALAEAAFGRLTAASALLGERR